MTVETLSTAKRLENRLHRLRQERIKYEVGELQDESLYLSKETQSAMCGLALADIDKQIANAEEEFAAL